MKEDIKKLLESFLQNKDYNAYNAAISKEITKYFVLRIKEYEKNYLYSSLVELKEKIEAKCTMQEVIIFRDYYLIMKEEEMPESKAIRLTEIYEKIEQLKDKK